MKRRSSTKHEGDELAELRQTLENLADQIASLTAAVDELVDEVQWRNNNRDGDGLLSPPFRLTSMPIDPTSDRFPINAVSDEVLSELRQQATEQQSLDPPHGICPMSRKSIATASANRQAKLFR